MNIFDYFDYRKYLKDYYENKKKQNFFFSYRYVGKKVELDPGYLVKVLQGKHHIAQKTISKFIKLCKMDENEGEYFENLVYFGKAKSEKQIKLYFEKLLSLKDAKTIKTEPNQYEYYQKWYYSAIRSLIGCIGFKGDYKSLAEKLSPKISVKETKKAIKLLEKLKFVKKQKDNTYTLTDTLITTGDEWHSIAIRQFQRETIHLAEESLTRHPKDIRDISTVTMGIHHEDLEEIKELLKEFRSSVMKFTEKSQNPDSVYQLNIQLIPLTAIKRNKK